MSGQRFSAPSVRQLAVVVERVAPRDPARWDGREKAPGAGGVPVQVSPERAKQLHMVLGMWDRAVGREEMPGRAARKVDQLFTPPALRAFWGLAVAGELRHFAKDVGKPLPVASQRTVRDCLKILAALVVEPGKRVRLPRVELAEPKTTVDPRQLTALYRELVDLAGRGPLERDGLGIKAQEHARLLALVSVVLDTGARVGELERLNVEDLDADLATLTVTRRPQHAGKGYEEAAFRLGVSSGTVSKVMSGQGRASEQLAHEIREEVAAVQAEGPRVERYALRHGTRVALRRWLDVRDALVAPLEGGKNALWVTVFPSKAGPPGIRIRAQGLGQSYARGVHAINFVMAGQPGWEPLPVRMEQLRRAVDAEPLEEDGPGNVPVRQDL